MLGTYENYSEDPARKGIPFLIFFWIYILKSNNDLKYERDGWKEIEYQIKKTGMLKPLLQSIKS